jgi:hypothetical protein
VDYAALAARCRAGTPAPASGPFQEGEPMDTSVATGLFTLGGTLAGGLAGVAGKTLADFMQARREREARQEQRRAEFQRWQREQVLALMTNSAKAANLYVSKRVGKRTVEEAQDDPVMQQASADLQGWLVALATVYPDTGNEDYRAFTEYLDKSQWQAVPETDPVWEIRKLLVKLGTRFANI